MIRRIALLLLLLIVGCSQKPIDPGVLIDIDGVMYLPDSDSPYTGEVAMYYVCKYKNDDCTCSGDKLYQGTYQNGLLIEYSYLERNGSIKEPINYETTLMKVWEGTTFEQYYTSIYHFQPYPGGQVFSLYDDGKMKREGTLKDGGWDGLRTDWYKNGQKKVEGTYEYSKLDGKYTDWYENGQKKSEGTYKDGHHEPNYKWIAYKEGLWTKWYENGQKSYKETYKNGKRDGLWTFWYGNRQKKYEWNYKDGKEDGLTTQWYRDGQKEYEGTWKDGKVISTKRWNEDGSVKE